MEDWTKMNDNLTKTENKIKILKEKVDFFKGLVEAYEKALLEEQRNKWWLEHPDVAYFTVRTWQMTVSQELLFCIDSVVSTDGSEIDWQIKRDDYLNFPNLKEKTTKFSITHRNPFLGL